MEVKLINMDGTLFKQINMTGPIYPMTVACEMSCGGIEVFRNDEGDPDEIYKQCNVFWTTE